MRLLISLLFLITPALAPAEEFREIDWLELMPPEEIELLEKMQDSIDHSGMMSMEQVGSSATVLAMDGTRGKMVGYIVPISISSRNEILEFFLVPYFGACIHVPPPPPNQIIHVKPAQPMPMIEIWDPYWVEGTLRIRKIENTMASASYAIDPVNVVPYQ